MDIYTPLYKISDYFKIFYSNNKICLDIPKDDKKVLIDIYDECNHMGDVLFFGPLIQGLVNNGCPLSVFDRHDFYKNLYSLKIQASYDYTIFRSYRHQDRLQNANSPSNLVNFFESSGVPISKWLYSRFLRSGYDQSLNTFISNLRKYSVGFARSKNIDSIFNSEYVIFSPFINSRRVGLYPPKDLILKDIIKQLNYYKFINKKIILVGQSVLLNDNFNLFKEYIDIDLMDQTNIYDLVNIIDSPKCIAVLSYDTFTYHLATLLKKRTHLYSKSWLIKLEYEWIKQRFTPAF